jgi:hypothetical protein
LQRHLEASGKARKGAAADAEGGTQGGCYWNGEQVAAALTRKGCDDRMPDKERLFAVLQPIGATDVSDSLVARNNQTTGFQTDVVATPTVYRWQNERDGLQQDDAVAALRASAGSSGFDEMNHPVIAQPVAFTPGNLARGAGASPNAEVFSTLRCSEGRGADDQRPCVAFQQNQLGEVRCNTVAGTVNTNSNASGRNTPMVAIGTDCYNGAITGNVAATMGTPGSSVNASGPTVMQAMAFPWQSALDPIGKPDDVCGTLIKNQVMGVAHSLRADGFDASEDGTGRGTPLVPVAPSLTATNDPSRSPQSSEVTRQVAAVHASTMTVRRLSARECERLQGFPDDWTLIPWRKKPAEECPDGPRYKALGNSMACNCMAWIGERIAAYEQRGRVDPTPAGTAGIAPAGDLNHEGDRHG